MSDQNPSAPAPVVEEKKDTAAPAAEAPAAAAPATAPAASTTALELRTKSGEIVNYDYGEDAGLGSANLPTSGFLPFLTVLQPLSDACTEGKEKFNPAARPGMFCLTGEDGKLFAGKDGLIFIPVHDRHTIVEKTALDQTGKVVGQTDGDPAGPTATALRNKFGPDKSKWRSEKGHFMIDRHDVTGVLFKTMEDVETMRPEAACIVSFERTKMRAYNRMSQAFNKYEPKKRPPLFAARIMLKTVAEQGEKGTFYNLALSFPVQDDFARSLIAPTAPMFADWRLQCRKVIAAIGGGELSAQEDGGKGASDVPDDGGKGKDIPF